MDSEENTNPETQTGQQPGQQSGGSGAGGATTSPTGNQSGESGNKSTTNTKPQIPEGYISQEQLNSIISERLREKEQSDKRKADEEKLKEQGKFEPLLQAKQTELDNLKTTSQAEIKAANSERDSIRATLAGYIKADLGGLSPEVLKLAPLEIPEKVEDFDATKLSTEQLTVLGSWIARAKGTAKTETGEANRKAPANRTGPPQVGAQTGDKAQTDAKARQRRNLKLKF